MGAGPRRSIPKLYHAFLSQIQKIMLSKSTKCLNHTKFCFASGLLDILYSYLPLSSRIHYQASWFNSFLGEKEEK
jgi:hypothetical protein